MAVPPAVVQVILTGAPPGNGLISLSVVTVAGRSPVFSTSKLQVMVSPGVAVAPGQSLFALAPVSSLGLRGIRDDKRADDRGDKHKRASPRW